MTSRSRSRRSVPTALLDTPHGPVISCDPRRQFGDPCIHGTRITADTIAGSVWAGDGVDETARDFDVDRLDILWCCAWWVDQGALTSGKERQRRRQWQAWANWAHIVLGGWHKNETLCDPDDFDPATWDQYVADVDAKVKATRDG